MNMHLFDFRWNNISEMEFQASLQEKFGRKPFSLNQDLSIEVTKKRVCAGSSRDNIWKPCPNKIENKKKCESCRAREGTFIFTSFDGFNTDIFTANDLAKIQGEHLVYLALFDKQLQKIGVCKAERKELRQVEQGSHFTLFIAKTSDGILARQIETLFRKSGVADKIMPSKKSGILVPEINKTEGKEILINILEEHKHCIQDRPQLKNLLLDKPIFKNWSEIYGLPFVKESSKSIHFIKLDIGESVSGKVRAIKGPFIILETEDELIAFSAKDLIGYELDFSPRETGIKLNNALQGSLF